MEKIKIAVWLDKNYKREIGGGFSYYDKLIHAIDNYQFDSSIEVCFVTENRNIDNSLHKKEILQLPYRRLYIKLLNRIIMLLPIINKRRKTKIVKMLELKYTRILTEAAVRVIYYIRQHEYILQDFPFIATNWDIGHCSTFAFPELTSACDFEDRHQFYTWILPRALMIFTESESGKAELLKYTNIDEKKIRIVPVFSGDCVNVEKDTIAEQDFLSENKLDRQKFFFYPAQFWAHKNHIGLLQAFSKFINLYPDYKLVFTGSDYGNLEYVQSFILELKLKDKVLFLGFLSIDKINILYRNAISLVMATYLGPTNMPLIEAMELGCPVICSDLKGHREILGKTAIYFNPLDKEELYNALLEMVNNRFSYKDAIEKQNKLSFFKIENSMQKLNEYLKEIAIIRNCWK